MLKLEQIVYYIDMHYKVHKAKAEIINNTEIFLYIMDLKKIKILPKKSYHKYIFEDENKAHEYAHALFLEDMENINKYC